MEVSHSLPTGQHEVAAKTTVEFFSRITSTEATILYGSCTRGKGTKDSCLEFLITVQTELLSSGRQRLEGRWLDFCDPEHVSKEPLGVGEYCHVDLEFTDRIFRSQPQ